MMRDHEQILVVPGPHGEQTCRKYWTVLDIQYSLGLSSGMFDLLEEVQPVGLEAIGCIAKWYDSLALVTRAIFGEPCKQY